MGKCQKFYRRSDGVMTEENRRRIIELEEQKKQIEKEIELLTKNDKLEKIKQNEEQYVGKYYKHLISKNKYSYMKVLSAISDTGACLQILKLLEDDVKIVNYPSKLFRHVDYNDEFDITVADVISVDEVAPVFLEQSCVSISEKEFIYRLEQKINQLRKCADCTFLIKDMIDK